MNSNFHPYGNSKKDEVALSTRDESILQRELSPLEAIKDPYPKYLLTLDADPTSSHNGIKKNECIGLAVAIEPLQNYFPVCDGFYANSEKICNFAVSFYPKHVKALQPHSQKVLLNKMF